MNDIGKPVPVVADLSDLPPENSGTFEVTGDGIGTFRWTPRDEDRGVYWVSFVATLGDVSREWACFIFTSLPGTNVTPIVTSPDTVFVARGDTISFQASATDANDEPIIWWIAHKPDRLDWYRDIVIWVSPMFPSLDSVATVSITTSGFGDIPLTVEARNSMSGTKLTIVQVTP